MAKWVKAPSESRGHHRCRHEVLFDTLDAWGVLGSYTHRLSLFWGTIVGNPDMHDAVSDDDVGRPSVNPLLSLQLGQQLFAHRPIVDGRVGRQLTSRCRQRPHEVRPADDPGELAVF